MLDPRSAFGVQFLSRQRSEPNLAMMERAERGGDRLFIAPETPTTQIPNVNRLMIAARQQLNSDRAPFAVRFSSNLATSPERAHVMKRTVSMPPQPLAPGQEVIADKSLAFSARTGREHQEFGSGPRSWPERGSIEWGWEKHSPSRRREKLEYIVKPSNVALHIPR